MSSRDLAPRLGGLLTGGARARLHRAFRNARKAPTPKAADPMKGVDSVDGEVDRRPVRSAHSTGRADSAG